MDIRVRNALLVAAMVLCAIPVYAQAPGVISGNVTVAGVPQANAVVGVKTTPSATADADIGYFYTDGSGHYATGMLSPGAYFVGVWVDGYRMRESAVNVDGDKTQDFALAAVQGGNAALQREIYGIGYWDREWPLNIKFGWWGDNNPKAIVNGSRDGTWSFVGDGRTTSYTPAHMVIDLGSYDVAVSQAVLTFHGDGRTWPFAYQVQYADPATYVSTDPPAVDDPSWTTWYSTPGAPIPNANRYEAISGPAVTARFWRLYATTSNGNAAGNPWLGCAWPVQEIELYADGKASGTVSGTVYAGGIPQPNTWVGIKGDTNALADAAYYVQTDASGNYVTPVLGPGKWNLSAWVPGFQFSDTAVVVNGNQNLDINLNTLQGVNYALNCPVFGGPHTREEYHQISAVDGDLAGDEGRFAQVWGDSITSLTAFGVDLGSDKTIKQALIDWRWYDHPGPGNYYIQYAVDGADNSLNSADWQTWYTGVPNRTGGLEFIPGAQSPGPVELIAGAPTTARYWRITYANADYNQWRSGFGLREFQLYSGTEFSNRLQGKVYIDSTPVYNAVVQIGDDNGPIVVTAADGSYSFAGLPEGEQEIYSDAVGAQPYTATINVTPGAILNHDIHLTADSGANLVPNGDFEKGTTGWVAEAGDMDSNGAGKLRPGWFRGNEGMGNDEYGNPLPAPNPDMYSFIALAGEGFGGGTAGALVAGNPVPNPGYRSKEFNNWNGNVAGYTTNPNTITSDGFVFWGGGWFNPIPDCTSHLLVTDGTIEKDYTIVACDSTTTATLDRSLAEDFGEGATGLTFQLYRQYWWHWYDGWARLDDSHRIPVQPGDYYNVYFKVKCPTTNSRVIAYYRVVFRDADGVRIRTSVPDGWDRVEVSRLAAWTQIAAGRMIRMPAPSNAATLSIEFLIDQHESFRAERSGGVLIDDIVVDKTPMPKINDYKGKPDGSAIRLLGKTVTTKPAVNEWTGEAFFYIEEPDRTSGIRVVDYSTNSFDLAEGMTVSVSGTIETDPETQERYLATDTLSSSGGIPIRPLGVTTKSINEDAKLSGLLTRVHGEVREVSLYSGYLDYITIADGYTKSGAEVLTKVSSINIGEDPAHYGKLKVGDQVTVTGVVSQTDPNTKLILLTDLLVEPGLISPPHFWSTGFEPQEGYTLGSIIGQDGWTLYPRNVDGGASPVGNPSAEVVAAPEPVLGAQALKLSAKHHAESGSDVIDIHKVLTSETNMRYALLRFKIWRQPGLMPDGVHPCTYANNLWWYSNDAYTNQGGQWDIENSTYGLYGGGGKATTVQGEFATMTRYVDFERGLQWTWYNGALIDSALELDTSDPKWSDIVFEYQATQPFASGVYDCPCYIDDLYLGWATVNDP